MDSVIVRLRQLCPTRPLSEVEAMTIAEAQAKLLIQVAGSNSTKISSGVIADLPEIRVHFVPTLPVAALSRWDRKGRGQILVKSTDPVERRRFSLAHEFKHLLDATADDAKVDMSEEQLQIAERICDHFAACLLMPCGPLASRWRSGKAELHELAQRYRVSRTAMRIRLRKLGLERRHKHRTEGSDSLLTITEHELLRRKKQKVSQLHQLKGVMK